MVFSGVHFGLAMAAQRKNRSVIILTKRADQLILIACRNRMSQDKQVKTAFATVSNGVSKSEGRSYTITLLLKQHMARLQQRFMVGDGKNLSGHCGRTAMVRWSRSVDCTSGIIPVTYRI